MKRLVSFFTCFTFIILFLGMSVSNIFALPGGPPDGVTGSPFDSGNNCTQCHTSFPVNPAGRLTFSITTPATYTPGTAQNVTVSFDNTTGGVFGFELMALDESDVPVGTLTEGGVDTQLGTSPNYIKQTAAGNTFGGTASWSFTWTPPAGQTGTVTFYAAGNEADGIDGNQGDYIYTATATSSEAGAVTDPVPDIKINGSNGPLTIGPSTTVAVTVSLNAGGNTSPADWWLYATSGGVTFYLNSSFTWGFSATPLRVLDWPLRDIPTTPIALPVASLPAGDWVFTFSVDDNADGVKDDTYTDSVSVTVRELSFSKDIVPLFTGTGAWFPYGDPDPTNGSPATACTACHSGNEEPEGPTNKHLIDFRTYAGWMAGADGGMMSLLGEAVAGIPPFDWDHSKLRSRLRDNRMPPGMPFNIDETNRYGGNIVTTNDGNDIDLGGGKFFVSVAGTSGFGEVLYTNGDTDPRGPNAIELLGAYVATLGGTDTTYAGAAGAVVFADIAGLFSENSAWFNGSVSCTACHFCDTEPPCFHMIDFDTQAGLLAGADEGSMPLLGETEVGDTDYSWGKTAKLYNRLRNNRMPPNAPFDVHELTRDGRTFPHPITGVAITAVDFIREWVVGPDGIPGNADDAMDN